MAQLSSQDANAAQFTLDQLLEKPRTVHLFAALMALAAAGAVTTNAQRRNSGAHLCWTKTTFLQNRAGQKSHSYREMSLSSSNTWRSL